MTASSDIDSSHSENGDNPTDPDLPSPGEPGPVQTNLASAATGGPAIPPRALGLSLTLRACLAAHRQAAHRAPADPAHPDLPDPVTSAPLWRDRAARLTRLTCSILGVDPACVCAIADPQRTFALFGHSDIRLLVTDTLLHVDASAEGRGGQEYEFIPAHAMAQPTTLDLLRSCPECTQPVPTYRIGQLADLGRIILAERGDGPLPPPDALQFSRDVAHNPGCTLRNPTQSWPPR
jgi:hypothetical protein